MSRLHYAARRGLLDEIVGAVSRGDDVNERLPRGQTALHLAADGGFADICKVLLQAGADPGAADHRGVTVLHEASSGGHLEVVRMICEAGAIIDPVDKFGFTPTLSAAVFHRAAIAEFLLSNGASAETKFQDRTVAEWLQAGGIETPQTPTIGREQAEAFASAVRSMMENAPTPEEYMGRYGRTLYVFSLGDCDLPDPEADAWAKRLTEIIRSEDLVRECQERYASPEDLALLRKRWERFERKRRAQAADTE